MDILVCGSTGFMGESITRGLLGAGHKVRALTRSPSEAIERLGSDSQTGAARHEGRLVFVQGDVTDAATLAPVVAGADAVVQAAQFKGAPVEDPRLGLTYDNVDRGGTTNLLRAIADSSGSPHFLYMSGIAVSDRAREPWNVAKWKAERAIRESGLPWTIVRSCWAYGPKDKALNRLLSYSDYLPFLPVFGSGQAALTPIYIGDVGRLFARLLGDLQSSRDTIFRLGGPDKVTLDEFLRTALRPKSRRRPILHIPIPIGKAAAALAQYLPWRPLTPDAVDFVSQEGAVTADDRRLLSERFPDYQTTPLEEGLSYLGD